MCRIVQPCLKLSALLRALLVLKAFSVITQLLLCDFPAAGGTLVHFLSAFSFMRLGCSCFLWAAAVAAIRKQEEQRQTNQKQDVVSTLSFSLI